MAIIEKPISVFTVANQLGYYEYAPHPVTGQTVRKVDLGRLCTHPNVNKWSKRKPYVDTRVSPPENERWRVSDINERIRSGFFISDNINEVWSYPRVLPNCAYRLADFAGYGGIGSPNIYLDMPSEFPPHDVTIDLDYIVKYTFDGGAVWSDSTVIGLQDLFDLEGKYCCLGLELTRGPNTINAYSDRVIYQEQRFEYEATVHVPLIDIRGLGEGEVTITAFFVEAIGISGGVLQSPNRFSLKHSDSFITTVKATLDPAKPFIIRTNFDDTPPYRNGNNINNSDLTRVIVDAEYSTGGLFADYWFRARVIDTSLVFTHMFQPQQILENEIVELPIPQFSLGPVGAEILTVEYTVWNGNPELQDSEEIISKNYFIQ